MQGDADIAQVAALIGDRTRARFLLELDCGRSLRASELAAVAGVSRATASFHLAKLLAAGVLVVQSNGRHRAYRLAGPHVAQVIEALQRIAPRREVRSLRTAQAAENMSYARFCYDHLAGRLAIELIDGLTAGGLITFAGDNVELTEQGASRLGELEIDVAALRAKRRSFARTCLDWSERQPHLAGALGAGLATRFLDLGWIKRAPTGRAVRLTPAGRTGLAKMFTIEV
ncbi:MAG: ArsR/SmtB family transcription factor [Solirubrobacteraceae bacterium]